MQFLKWSFVTLVFVIVLVLTVYFNGYEYSWPKQENNGPGKLINGIIFETDNVPGKLIKEIILERNVLSNQLNNARKLIGQLQCEVRWYKFSV